MNICSNNLDYASQHKARANNFKFCKFDSKRHPGTVITRVKLVKMLVNRMIEDAKIIVNFQYQPFLWERVNNQSSMTKRV